MRSEFGIDILGHQTRKRALFLTRSWVNNSTNQERADWRLEAQIKASTELVAQGFLKSAASGLTRSLSPRCWRLEPPRNLGHGVFGVVAGMCRMWRMWWAEALALSLLMFCRCRIWLPYDPVGAVAAALAAGAV
jgi:hypothetical protein